MAISIEAMMNGYGPFEIQGRWYDNLAQAYVTVPLWKHNDYSVIHIVNDNVNNPRAVKVRWRPHSNPDSMDFNTFLK